MANKLGPSNKRIQVNKANVFIVAYVAVACFITVFSLTAAKTLLSQHNYQAKVITKKSLAEKTLKANLQARDQLVSSYKTFEGQNVNAIGGNSTGSGDRDGDNAKIVLDALPSKYDYPALATSLEKLMNDSQLTITSITGTDDELNQASNQRSSTPAPVDMPFVVGFDGTPDSTQAFLAKLENSIRPIQIQQITLNGNESKLSVSVTAKTYFQPEKHFSPTKEVVK